MRAIVLAGALLLALLGRGVATAPAGNGVIRRRPGPP
jgi:hypothetical protein